MREAEYREAAVEVLDILNHINKEDVERIPQSFIKFLTNISNKRYKVKFNYEQPIKGLNLRKQTRELLGFIYITWWCDKEEREKYKKLIHENNIKNEGIKENYNLNDIFKNRRESQELKLQNENVMTTSIVEYKKENIFQRVLNKILSLFNSKSGSELQKGCTATCVVIQNEDCKELDSKIIVNSNCSDSELLNTIKEIDSNKEVSNYFVIYQIDKVGEETQDKFYQIVKDREFNGHKLPKNMIIVLTVKDREGLQKILQELYHFCVVAF